MDGEGKGVVIVIAVLIVIGLFSQCGGTNSNDGKCDICNKSATQRINGEEYCNTHYFKAVEWYFDEDR